MYYTICPPPLPPHIEHFLDNVQKQFLDYVQKKIWRASLKAPLARLSFCFDNAGLSSVPKQGNYSLRRPPKLIIPQIFIEEQRWAIV